MTCTGWCLLTLLCFVNSIILLVNLAGGPMYVKGQLCCFTGASGRQAAPAEGGVRRGAAGVRAVQHHHHQRGAHGAAPARQGAPAQAEDRRDPGSPGASPPAAKLFRSLPADGGQNALHTDHHCVIAAFAPNQAAVNYNASLIQAPSRRPVIYLHQAHVQTQMSRSPALHACICQ